MPGQTKAITAKTIANTPRIARSHQLPIRTCAISMLRASGTLAYCDREWRQFRRNVEPRLVWMDTVRVEIGYRRARLNRVSAFRQIRARCGVAVISEATRAFVDG